MKKKGHSRKLLIRHPLAGFYIIDVINSLSHSAFGGSDNMPLCKAAELPPARILLSIQKYILQ
jgi:hypothetical protein